GGGRGLGVAEKPQGETAQKPVGYPLPGDPERWRQCQRPPLSEPRAQGRNRNAEEPGVQATVGSQRDDGQPRHGPRYGAVVLERVVEPAQEENEEHRARQPPVGKGLSWRSRQGASQRQQQPHPSEDRPIRRRKRERPGGSGQREREPAGSRAIENAQRPTSRARGGRPARAAARP